MTKGNDDSTPTSTYQTIPIEELLREFKSQMNGLTSEEAHARLSTYGKNKLKLKKPHPILVVLGYLLSGFGAFLWVSALVVFLSWKPIGDPPDPQNLALAIILVLVALLSASFTAYQEFQSNQIMKSLRNMMSPTIMVYRDQRAVEIDAISVVPGDVITLQAGQRIPADVRFLSLTGLRLDTSSLTGESETVVATLHSTDENPVLSRNMGFFGCSVAEGSALGLVIATGNNTVMAKIAQAAMGEPHASALQTELRRLITIIAVLGSLCLIAVIVAWAAWLRVDYPDFLNVASLITTCVGIGIAFLPEGLPVSVALTVSSMARRMFQHRVLVRNLGSVEVLGSVNLIASDKTGTLTQNVMTLNRVWLAGSLATSEDFHHQVESEYAPAMELHRALCLCSGASRPEDSSMMNGGGRQSDKILGDASDVGIFRAAARAGDPETIRAKYPKVAGVPFSSRLKSMISIHRQPSGQLVLYMKGAAEQMVHRCTSAMAAADSFQEVPLSSTQRDELLHEISKLAELGQRVLAVCCSFPTFEKIDANPDPDQLPLNAMCFLGLVSLADPPRVEVKSAIQQCHAAGIKVIMVTGDHPSTAVAIAKLVGIVQPFSLMHRLEDFISAAPVVNGQMSSYGSSAAQNRVFSVNASRGSGLATRKVDSELSPLLIQASVFDDETPLVLQQCKCQASIAVTGAEIPSLTTDHWDWIYQHRDIVFARTTPEQKLQIVREFQQRGACAAVTGDGVNDAPALRQADIGVCMGSGAEIAREASDIVLLDDNFASILIGVEHGRLLFENLRKVILYLLPAGTWSELLPVLANVFLGLPLPLSSFLMIYICAITDMVSSLSLITEHAESDLILRPPRNRKTVRLVSWKMLLDAYLYRGTIMSLCAFGFYFLYLSTVGGFPASELMFLWSNWQPGFHGKTADELNELLLTAQSIYFLTLVEIQLFNIFATRTRRLSMFQQNPLFGPHANRRVFLSAAVSMTLAAILLLVPFFNNVFNTRSPPLLYWFAPFACGVGLLLMDEMRKLVARQFPLGIVAKLSW